MIDSITERTTVLTPNSRLSRWLMLQYANRQKNLGKSIWDTPDILPLQSWLKKLWVNSWPINYVLSNLQSKEIWQDIIRSDKNLTHLNLLHVSGTANQAAKAFSQINEYLITSDSDAFKGADEFEFFHSWMSEYEQRLNQHKALDPSQVMDYVRSALHDEKIPLPTQLIIAGFDEITPQFQRLLNLLQDRNIPIQFWPDEASAITSQTYNLEIRPFDSVTDEAIQCARWIRKIYDDNPMDKTVGVVVPDISEYRVVLERELTAELTPRAIFPWEEVEPRFNMDTGTPLSLEPCINLALLLISIQKVSVPIHIFSTILNTPFLNGGRTEQKQRHDLDLKLRSRNTVSVHFELLNKYLNNTPQLTLLINALRHQNRSNNLPSFWAYEFSYLLKQHGWPHGDDKSSTVNNQIIELWKECLDDLASLDMIVGDISRSNAVDKLQRIAQNKSSNLDKGEHPIQIVRFSESFGMQFDYLWIIGCHSESIPATPTPNPFIPLHLQKKHNLPRTTPHQEIQYAEKMLYQLISLSANTVISFPERNARTELRHSPLLRNFIASKSSEPIEHSHRIRDHFPTSFELFEDITTLPMIINEKYAVSDGYQILKNQSDCPFRAFIRHRLNARTLNIPEIDYHSAERGNIVHKALCIFWRDVKTSESLRSLKSKNQLLTKLNQSVCQAIESYKDQVYNQSQFTKLEIQRLEQLLINWLDKELKRTDFTVIDTEKEVQIQVGRMELNTRIDRIDDIGGRKLLIDYKTGRINQDDWLEDRLQEIQLPLYAIKIRPDATVFAEVNKVSSGNGFKFIARDDSILPGFKSVSFENICPDWDSLLERWKSQLEFLADEFMDGRVDINPHNSDTCNHCGLQTLCRIEEYKPGNVNSEDLI